MKLEQLAEINRCRAAREAVALVTYFASDETRLVLPEAVAGDPLAEVGFSFSGASASREPVPTSLAEAIREAFRSGKSGLVETEVGKVFVHVHVPPVKLVMIGAVHISQVLAEMARVVGLDCVIVDPREAFATPERFPGAFAAKVDTGFASENVTQNKPHTKLIAEWPDVALPPLKLDRYTAFVALTHDPKIDDPAILHALGKGCFYLGALGSRRTHAKRLERLGAAGISEAALAGIHAPIGLDIGAVSPAEIAVSILGEIIAAMRQKRRAPETAVT